MNKLYFKDDNKFYCYHITSDNDITTHISYILDDNFIEKPLDKIVQVGPHDHFNSAFSSNVTNILNRIGFKTINRFEKIKLYDINEHFEYDKMLEKIYDDNINNTSSNYPEIVDINDLDSLSKYGLGFDSQEIELYKSLYSILNRYPIFIEIFA